MSPKLASVLAALCLFALWTGATWVLEGRIETFLRPEAVLDRLVYTGIANLLIGILGAALVLRYALRAGGAAPALTGLGPRAPSALWVPLGFAAGLALYFVQGAPSTDPVVILNAYAQVLVVSAAEVMVCWAVVAGLLASAVGGPGWRALPVAAVAASLMFGLYHFAHSPPFNTAFMVGFLSLVGLVTSSVFFLTRDVYATLAFHNFLGVFGVVRALAEGGQIESFRTPQAPLIVTALVALGLLVAADRLLIRRSV